MKLSFKKHSFKSLNIRRLSKINMQPVFNLSFILIMLLASGCAATTTAAETTIQAGEIIPITTESTLWIMRAAIDGARNTVLLSDGQNGYLFARYLGNEGWGWVALNYQGTLTPSLFQTATGGNGNIVQATDMDDLLGILRDHGWKAIPATKIPEALRLAILESALWQLANTFTTFAFFFVPVGITDVNYWIDAPVMVD